MSRAGRAGEAVFVTGATGAIGPPLIDALLARGVGRVYALSRHAAHGRHDPRIRPVVGDITRGATLGIEDGVAHEIQSTAAAIIHAAADTRFAAPMAAAHRVNALGTANVIEFGLRCPLLNRVVFLSTTHVAGRRTGNILEDQLAHDAGFVNAYEASKYEAECALRQRSGLPISVCRLSTVIGDSHSGEIGRRGAIHQAVRLMYASLAPMLPGREDSPVDLIALEYAVDAIGWLATGGFEPGRTWHVCAGEDAIPAGELLDLTIDCFHTYRPSWRKRAIARPAIVDLGTFELFRQSVEQIGDPALRAATAVIGHFAPQLAFPKRFDDRVCATALAGAAIRRPPARSAWRNVVRTLVEPGAAPAQFPLAQAGARD